MDSTVKGEGSHWTESRKLARCGPSAAIPDRKQEMTSAAMQQLCRGGGGRKERSREVGATPQLHQHYCSLPE